MSNPKQASKRLQAIDVESEQAVRKVQTLIDLTRSLSEADARLARARSEVGADLNGGSPRGKKAAWFR
jgi:hypothetical protein